MLVDKLPDRHKLNWAMHPKNGKVPVVKAFSDWIVSAASQVVSLLVNKKGASVLTHSEPSYQSKLKCSICKGQQHKIQNCGEFQSLSVDERWSVVK